MNNLITIIPVSSFDNAKTRLSPFLTNDERKILLQVMLKDIILSIKSHVDEIFIVSRDEEVLNYAKKFDVKTIIEEEHDENYLNNALIDAVNYVKNHFESPDILIIPSDIPLFNENNINYIKKHDYYDVIISPSMGGGTNLLYMKYNRDININFGEFSYFKHVEDAKKRDYSIKIYDSFFLSLDINTPQDLGELLLHGTHTNTFKFLNSLNIVVKNKHGQDRLDVQRKND